MAASRVGAPAAPDPGLEIVGRDRRTIEIRQLYLLPRAGEEQRGYALDLYLYFPRSFGISEATWGREQFYRDATVLSRLHAVRARLRDLADMDLPQNPGAVLRGQLPALLLPNPPSGEALAMLAQLYGAELTDAALGDIGDLLALTRQGARADLIEAEVERACGDTLRALGSLRRLRVKASVYQGVAPPALLSALAFTEEYATAVIEEGLADLAGCLAQAQVLRDGRGAAVRVGLRLAHAAQQVSRRRQELGFAVPWDRQAEHYAYRQGQLKKELQRALYVNTRALARDPFYRNSAAMVAAGLAATWATLAQVPLWSHDITGQERLLVVGAAVGAYVLKDRIKEWTRGLLADRLLRWDHDRHIVGDTLERLGMGAFRGRARERVRYLGEGQVPVEVTALRRQSRTVQGVASELEQVLHYRRQVTLESGRTPVPEGYGVLEVFRLSLGEIIRRLDDPVDKVAYFDPRRGRMAVAEVPKVYHLNLVLVSARGGEAPVRRRIRVVVNRSGIVRIEPVAGVGG